jgi:predicted CXXCH cytochrome family protein
VAATGGLLWASSLRLAWLAERPLLPTRFEHRAHTTVGCTTCHHNFVTRGLGAMSCLACHKAWGTSETRRIDVVFHGFCTGCHRDRRAAGRKSGPVKACAACHVRLSGSRPP